MPVPTTPEWDDLDDFLLENLRKERSPEIISDRRMFSRCFDGVRVKSSRLERKQITRKNAEQHPELNILFVAHHQID
jgi:hypothetical protein